MERAYHKICQLHCGVHYLVEVRWINVGKWGIKCGKMMWNIIKISEWWNIRWTITGAIYWRTMQFADGQSLPCPGLVCVLLQGGVGIADPYTAPPLPTHTATSSLSQNTPVAQDGWEEVMCVFMCDSMWYIHISRCIWVWRLRKSEVGGACQECPT